MKLSFFTFSLLIALSLSSKSFGQDHVLLQLKDHKKFVIASEHGIEVYSYELNRLGQAKGSGNTPVDLELTRGEHCFVLTQGSLDYYYVNVHGGALFKATVPLEKENPTDLEFLNKGKDGVILVIYQGGLQNFNIRWHSHSVEIVPERTVSSIGMIP